MSNDGNFVAHHRLENCDATSNHHVVSMVEEGVQNRYMLSKPN
jgi:hypothetical protein